ncbi:MAG: hypothetical protein ACRDL7_10600 [Gaiellaceae bacterium]
MAHDPLPDGWGRGTLDRRQVLVPLVVTPTATRRPAARCQAGVRKGRLRGHDAGARERTPQHYPACVHHMGDDRYDFGIRAAGVLHRCHQLQQRNAATSLAHCTLLFEDRVLRSSLAQSCVITKHAPCQITCGEWADEPLGAGAPFADS